MSKRWMDTGYLKSTPVAVHADASTISGVKVCSAGEAKGHGVHLDHEFIEAVAAQGNAARRGLKARFGHPNMCSESLGTYIGRFTNFSTTETIRDDGTKAACVVADLQLSETAKDTPNGDLHAYILEMAASEPDMFGTSIVFARGENYRRDPDTGAKVYEVIDGEHNHAYDDIDGPTYATCRQLIACDCVDEPAANDGLFSAFSGETVAGRITEFLDLHPQVFQALTDHPEILEAVAQYGEQFDQFVSRYQQYRTRLTHGKEDSTMPETLHTPPDGLEENAPQATEETPTPAAEQEQIEASAAPSVDVQATVAEALAHDRQRMAEIEELGEKFGFVEDAKTYKADGSSVDQFRQHILNKSPQEWQASLAIKNPAIQPEEQPNTAAEDAALAAVKSRRAAVYGQPNNLQPSTQE